MFNITDSAMLWDEVSHLTSGSLLYMGRYGEFLGNAFYPPLFDVITFIFFKIFGISLFVGRLPSVLFAGLTLWAVFELAYYMYDGKVALLSAVMLGIMPGVFWVSGHAMLEIVLMFFVTVSLLFFYRWLNTCQDRMLVLSGLTLGLGFLAKYQILIAGVIMLLSILLLARKQLVFMFKKFSVAVVVAVLTVIPWIAIAYQVYKNGILSQWLYALQVGNPERAVYSSNFPAPIFYIIAMVWPQSTVHPISIFCYILGLTGLVFMIWRHRREDKFILLWFTIIFVFFTLISNKDWRYVTPLFPTLAISASVVVLAVAGALRKAWKTTHLVSRKCLVKVASVIMAVTVAGAMFYSVYDTYTFNFKDNIVVDVQGATDYALANLEDGKSIVILCPCNLLNMAMVNFYVWEKGEYDIEVFQYPFLAVDAYAPDFNVTEFIELCQQHNVQYVLFYEFENWAYYGTSLYPGEVFNQLYATGKFASIPDDHVFGTAAKRVFIIDFTG